MNGFRISAAIVAALASVALTVAAQGTTTADPKKPVTDAPKADARKADPSKKAVPEKKAAPAKKAPPKKAPAKKGPDGKAQPTASGGTIEKYEAGKAPDLKDGKGNTVSPSPHPPAAHSGRGHGAA